MTALERVKQNGEALEYIKEQTPEVCLAAVNQNGCALKYVKEQTLEICIAAINQNGDSLAHVQTKFRKECEEHINGSLSRTLPTRFMLKELNNITIERFIDQKKIIRDCLIVVSFIVFFLLSSYIENNLFLPNNGIGLLQHINIWIFILINLMIPVAIRLNYKKLEVSLNDKTLKNLNTIFNEIATCKPIMFLWTFSRVCGFCFFVGNSLQNAHIINPLPFDYWDSINYIMSYLISRIYKLYLFAYFIPISIVYVSILIISVSKLLELRKKELTSHSIQNHMQSKALCNFSLNLMLTIVIPVICFSSGVYFIHKRFDITTITTMIICVSCTFMSLGAYLLFARLRQKQSI